MSKMFENINKSNFVAEYPIVWLASRQNEKNKQKQHIPAKDHFDKNDNYQVL